MNKNYILESRFTCAGCRESLGKAFWEDRVLDGSVHCLPLSLVEPLVHSGQLRQVHLGGQPLCIIVSLCPYGKVPHDLLDFCFNHSFTKAVVDILVCGWCVSHETVTIFCNCDLTALSLHFKFARCEIISTYILLVEPRNTRPAVLLVGEIHGCHAADVRAGISLKLCQFFSQTVVL